MSKKRALSDRFWEKVDIGDDHECWPWQASKNRAGYGKIGIGKHSMKPVGAHRVAFALSYGYNPEDMLVCHTCDNPSCCNPKHLFLGTDYDNIRDAYNKGRMRIHKENLISGYNEPAREATRKLSDDDVKTIRFMYLNHHYKGLIRDLIYMYGATRWTISSAARGETFKDVSLNIK